MLREQNKEERKRSHSQQSLKRHRVHKERRVPEQKALEHWEPNVVLNESSASPLTPYQRQILFSQDAPQLHQVLNGTPATREASNHYRNRNLLSGEAVEVIVAVAELVGEVIGALFKP